MPTWTWLQSLADANTSMVAMDWDLFFYDIQGTGTEQDICNNKFSNSTTAHLQFRTPLTNAKSKMNPVIRLDIAIRLLFVSQLWQVTVVAWTFFPLLPSYSHLMSQIAALPLEEKKPGSPKCAMLGVVVHEGSVSYAFSNFLLDLSSTVPMFHPKSLTLTNDTFASKPLSVYI